MRHSTAQQFLRLILYAPLAGCTWSCGADSDHGPPIGSPPGPVGPIVVEAGGSSAGRSSTNPNAGTGMTEPNGGASDNAGTDSQGFAGSGSAGRDPFGVGGSGTQRAPSGSAGTPNASGGLAPFG